MAMGTETKLYIAIGVLVVLGGALYFQNKSQKAEAESYSESGRAAALPQITLVDETVKGIDKVVLNKAADGDGGAAVEVELTRSGEEWRVTKPVNYLANQANVKSLLDSLKRLKTSEQISGAKDQYSKFGVGDGEGLHAVFYAGNDVKLDVRFGEGGSRGQMARVGGHDGVFSVQNYSSFTFDRDLKSWRDLSILKFDEKAAESVELSNEHGVFQFEKAGDTWKAKHKKPKAPAAAALADFDGAKVDELLRAFKALNAADFGDGKAASEVGLSPAVATLSIKLSGGKENHVISFGNKADGSNVWLKLDGNEQLFQVSSWAADWGTAEPSKFSAKSGDAAGAAPPSGLPEGLDLGGLDLGGMGLDDHEGHGH